MPGHVISSHHSGHLLSTFRILGPGPRQLPRRMVWRLAVISLFIAAVCGGDDDGAAPGGEAADAAGEPNFLVLVTLGEVPLPDVDVVFHAPDGTVAAHVKSDASVEPGGESSRVARSRLPARRRRATRP